ncbi:MAG: glycosyltransferase family 1 protein [Clostridia bacterium]|nr:glycosyltransferase family 1 protein [Clostridia bacterium]
MDRSVGKLEKPQKIRIAYDVQPLVSYTRTGIENVTISVLESMVALHADITLTYFSKGKTDKELHDVLTYGAKGAKLCPCAFFRSMTYNALWLFLPVPYRWFFRYEAELTHFQNNYVPPGVKGKTVATIHDIIPLLHPEWVTRKAGLRARLCSVRSCKRADHIVTDSHYSKLQIVEHCKVSPEKITVIPCALDHGRFHEAADAAMIQRAKENYGIDGDYYFYIGSVVPHKNLGMLIRAYARALDKDAALPMLVLGGGGRSREALDALAAELGVGSRVKLIGYVDDAYVPALMHGAVAFVFPSLYEGFGLPPLEAMACGTPVVCSNATSLSEVVCDAGILLNPEDPEAWAEALITVARDRDKCTLLRWKGLMRAKLFTREAMMEKLRAVYAQVKG